MTKHVKKKKKQQKQTAGTTKPTREEYYNGLKDSHGLTWPSNPVEFKQGWADDVLPMEQHRLDWHEARLATNGSDGSTYYQCSDMLKLLAERKRLIAANRKLKLKLRKLKRNDS